VLSDFFQFGATFLVLSKASTKEALSLKTFALI